MRLLVVFLIVLVSVIVLEASPYGKRAKDRLTAWKPKALREKEAREAKVAEEAKAAEEAKLVEKPNPVVEIADPASDFDKTPVKEENADESAIKVNEDPSATKTSEIAIQAVSDASQTTDSVPVEGSEIITGAIAVQNPAEIVAVKDDVPAASESVAEPVEKNENPGAEDSGNQESASV